MRKPKDKAGGILLSGTHVESCVDNSFLLQTFLPPQPGINYKSINERQGWGFLSDSTLGNPEIKKSSKNLSKSR